MAQILDGKVVRDEIAQNLKSIIYNLKSKPQLVIIQVGDLAQSSAYINQKIKFGERIGAIVELKKFPSDVSQEILKSYILNLNSDKSVHGIIIQMPIPETLDKEALIELIDPRKDVDGLTTTNQKLLEGNSPDAIVPATAKGVITILNYYKIPIKGQKVTVVGRSRLVGAPVATLLKNLGAQVTVCHSKTEDLAAETKGADIIVSAVGKISLITKDHVSKGQTIIDVGINVVEAKGQALSQDAAKEKDLTLSPANSKWPMANGQRRLVGDVNFAEVSPIVAAITPVPGGIGPMTVASLFENLLQAYKKTTCLTKDS